MEQAERRIEWVEANLDRVGKCTKYKANQLKLVDATIINDIRVALEYSPRTTSTDIWSSICRTYNILTKVK